MLKTGSPAPQEKKKLARLKLLVRKVKIYKKKNGKFLEKEIEIQI
jgi:hypothetical protein